MADDAQWITVEELLQRIDAACDGMGAANPHKVLFKQCKEAITYLVVRVPDESLRTQIVRPG